jgi:hypothetical protein
MDEILNRFDDAWNGPAPPSIEDLLQLSESARRRALWIELISIDLQRRSPLANGCVWKKCISAASRT